MLKSRVFSFNEQNLLRDIAEFKNTTGREASELQCNTNTLHVWYDLYENMLNYPSEISGGELSKGIVGKYQGIPIAINNKLDNGTINIK